MKQLIVIVFMACAALFIMPASAYASSGAAPKSNVTITVVMPDTVPARDETELEPVIENPIEICAPTITLYPARVEEKRENGGRQIIKVYQLGALENPSNIPRDGFVRDGWEYELSDITRAETATADAKEHVETIELNTDTKEMESIMQQLQPTLEYISEDGYAGFLSLNIASIKVEQAGTRTSNYTLTAKREYPHLSSNDTSLIPKTITDGGKTYTLLDVDWKAGNTVTVDYEAMPEYYTAYATYTASGSKTVVTGYITTAEYLGTISKIGEGKTVYTACFLGKEIVPERIPLEIVEQVPVPAALEAVSTPPVPPSPTATPELTPTLEPTVSPERTAKPKAEAENAEPEEQPGESAGLWAAVIALSILCALLIGGGAGYFISKNTNLFKRKDE